METHTTYNAGTDSRDNVPSLVYTDNITSGKIMVKPTQNIIMANDIPAMRCKRCKTRSTPPAPIRLLTKELAVVESDCTGMRSTTYTLLTILAMASSLWPSLSSAIKNTNHIAMERKYCTIVNIDISSIRPTSLKSIPDIL